MTTEFFLPMAESEEQAKSALRSICEFNELRNPIAFFGLSYVHNGTNYHVKVGENHSLNGEVVIAILKEKHKGAPFLICTRNRGVSCGDPIFANDFDFSTNAVPFKNGYLDVNDFIGS